MRATIADIFRGRNGQWYVRLVAGNGRIIGASEGYTRKWDAKRAAKRIAPHARVREAGR